MNANFHKYFNSKTNAICLLLISLVLSLWGVAHEKCYSHQEEFSSATTELEEGRKAFYFSNLSLQKIFAAPSTNPALHFLLQKEILQVLQLKTLSTRHLQISTQIKFTAQTPTLFLKYLLYHSFSSKEAPAFSK